VATASRTGGFQASSGSSDNATICARSRAMRPAPGRSALFTTNTSATSSSPAFIACTESPPSGVHTTTTVSATSITASSDWPTPTVSTTTRS
jgi:hypothetical protein